ncbi:hypothetical protein [Candidatus Cryosericum septentrionale]|jgi:hypothetical protein|nr:hypothetical protein [Candidatus Cryosericum septentrionale]
MNERTRTKRMTSLRRDLLGMLTEVAFAGGLIGVAFLISWLFFVGR